MKLSDYIFKKLVEHQINQVFLVTGGGAMHLNDSIKSNKYLNYLCNHNEQASAMAAEGYARVSNKPAITCVTSGPGAINALNGVFGAYTDSIPMIIISGQSKMSTYKNNYPNLAGLRQLGDQEVDIISMAKKITKYSKTILDPNEIRFELEKAIFLCQDGRPGPVWLDIPVDIQSSKVDETKLSSYNYKKHKISVSNLELDSIYNKILKSSRPIVLVSNGINISKANQDLRNFLDYTKIPLATAWAHDVIEHSHPSYIGKQGSIGDRSGNFSVQNADLVIIIGSRMPIRQVSYNWENFAKSAYIIQVDIDENELKKPTLKIDLPIVSDAKIFIKKLTTILKGDKSFPLNKHVEWLEWCKIRRKKYPVLQNHHCEKTKPLNPYFFISKLQENIGDTDIISCADATACIVAFQTSNLKRDQKLFSNSGSASMGYGLPAAIGAATADKNRQVICLCGDGSIQMNIQELQTVLTNKLNIKIFVLSNGGYLSIKLTQKGFFNKSIGNGQDKDLEFPDMIKIAKAYGFKTFSFQNHEFEKNLKSILSFEGPVLINVDLDPNQGFEPKLSSRKLENGTLISSPLEDMSPFLDRDELNSNMIFKNE